MGTSSTATASENRSKYSRLSFAAVPLPQRGRLIKGNPKRIIDQDGCAKRAFPAGEGGPQRRKTEAIEPRVFAAIAVDEVDHTDALSREKRSFTKTAYAFVCPPGLAPAPWALAQNPPPRNAACWWDHPAARARKTRFFC